MLAHFAGLFGLFHGDEHRRIERLVEIAAHGDVVQQRIEPFGPMQKVA